MKLSISGKIIFIAAMGVIVSSVIILCISTILMGNLVTRTIHEDMAAMQSVIVRMQQQEEAQLLQEVQLLTAMPQIINALHEGDIETIREIAQTSLRRLGLDAITFTDARGIVLTRGHSDLKGDDLSVRPAMRRALNGEIISGIFFDETALVPYAIRCYAPIYRGNVLLGAMTLGIEIGTEEYVDNLNQISGLHFTLYKDDVSYMTSIMDKDGNRLKGSKPKNTQITDAVLNNGETIIIRSKLLDDSSMIAFWPIRSADDAIIGMWAISKSLVEQDRETSGILLLIILCSLGIMFVLIFAASILGRKIALPIRMVTEYAVQVANGNLDISIELQNDEDQSSSSGSNKKTSHDEVGLLIGALKTMVATLKERINQNELQLTKLHVVVKATKMGLWDMEIVRDDAVNIANNFKWSNEFRRMLGYKDENDFPNIYNSWTNCIHPDDKEKIISTFEKHLMDTTGQTPYDIEYRLKKKNGEWGYFRDSGETIRDEDGHAIRVAGALLDITEMKNLINEAEEQRTEAENANKAKSAFLSTMSHEIRTPMNAILGITEILLQDEELEQNLKTSLEKVYTSGDMLLGIINDILDLSKIEAGKLELLVGKYDTASIISDTAQLNMMRIGSKPIEFELVIDENTPVSMLGDELRIKQIFNNLLSNAFKYTESGTVVMTITTEPAKNDDEIYLVISVKDTGQGMSKEQVEKLFDEYSRFNLEANRKSEGTGLGMSITRNLIQLMSGNIKVESEPGKGSTFTVRLLQSIADPEILGSEMAENLQQFRTSSRANMKRVQISREPMPYGSVLIVDDVETNIFVAKGLLAPYDLMIDTASSGFAAIEKIKGDKVYDIIFMDHMMPQMDGIEATKIIRGMGYDQPIVALTANAVAGQANIFLENGFTDFISKPIDIRQMNVVLNKLIRDKQPPEVLEAARQRAEAKKEQTAEKLNQTVDPLFVEIFMRDATRSFAVLNEIVENDSYDESNLRTFVIHTHGLKSALTYIGKMDISAVALKLEQLGRDKNIDVIKAEAPTFLVSLKTIINELTKENPDEEVQNEDINYLQDKLLEIKSACEEYDEVTANKSIMELREKTWSGAVKEMLGKIAEHLLHSDFDEIVEIINNR